jgi:hypothetical protein
MQKSWEEQVFTVSGDVERLAGNLEFLTGSTTADSKGIVAEAIVQQKAEMAEVLDGILPQIFERSDTTVPTFDNFLSSYGWSWDNLDQIRNRILNPSCLKQWSHAGVITRLLNRRLLLEQGAYNVNREALTDSRDYWQNEATTWRSLGIKNITIDFSANGVADHGERRKTHKTLLRG